MSRLGKRPVRIPTGAVIETADGIVKVKGPKGELTFPLDPVVSLDINGDMVKVNLEKPGKNSKALWGLTRAMIANMFAGVTQGFEKKLELVGVGYRVKQDNQTSVVLSVGYSHPVEFNAPAGITIEVLDNQNLVIKGIDKELVGQVAANIRKVRKPEPYKGKGIKYATEVVRRKAGKAGKAGK